MPSAPEVVFIDQTDPYLWEALETMGFSCVDHSKTDRATLLQEISRFFGLVIRSRIQLDQDFLARATRLRFIARSGVGLDHIDVDYAASQDILVLPAPEGSRDTVGEHTVGLLLALMNNLARADREVRNGQWIREGNRGVEIKGKTIGIIGYGNMGSAFAQRLQGFGTRVIAYDKYKENYGNAFAEAVAQEVIFAEADIVSFHIPYTPENHHLVNAAYLQQFAKHIYLINTSRGLILHTADLVARLKTGHVLGAALDVIEYEEPSFRHLEVQDLPAPFQYLRTAPNVVLSPHIAGWSNASERGHAVALADKIRHHFHMPTS